MEIEREFTETEELLIARYAKAEASKVALLAAARTAHKILGEIPSGVLGTKEPVYQAFSVLETVIEIIDADSSREDKR